MCNIHAFKISVENNSHMLDLHHPAFLILSYITFACADGRHPVKSDKQSDISQNLPGKA